MSTIPLTETDRRFGQDLLGMCHDRWHLAWASKKNCSLGGWSKENRKTVTVILMKRVMDFVG